MGGGCPFVPPPLSPAVQLWGGHKQHAAQNIQLKIRRKKFWEKKRPEGHRQKHGFDDFGQEEASLFFYMDLLQQQCNLRKLFGVVDTGEPMYFP